MKQKIAFLYLNTGGGHAAPAKALANEITSRWGDTDETVLLHGFSDKMKIARFFFENGYSVASNYLEPGWVLFYQATQLPICIRFGNYLVSLNGLSHLTRMIRENGITKVVCMHEGLIIMARNAIDRVNSSIPLITVVTDPFTAHKLWFYVKNTELVVFSEQLRKEAIAKHGIQPDRIHAFPFIFSSSFEHRYTEREIIEARKRLGLPDGKKVILIAGGGEGLKNAERIVSCFVRRKSDEILIVVCGRNKVLRRMLELIIARHRAQNVILFGFVSFMQDLINVSDCVITKGGPSTIMEVLSTGKPLIFSTYIRGQERGNVFYSIYNGTGWYIKKPSDILDKAHEIIVDPECQAKVRKNTERLGIRNGLEDVMTFIHNFKSE
jgi:processive 1,2-diacylglycerol beta-glucosyltransferase/1,2-diacylglycerol 3-beta-galactosyltransferase